MIQSFQWFLPSFRICPCFCDFLTEHGLHGLRQGHRNDFDGEGPIPKLSDFQRSAATPVEAPGDVLTFPKEF